MPFLKINLALNWLVGSTSHSHRTAISCHVSEMDSLEFMKATRGPERNKLPIHVVLQKPIPKTVV
jgi:hypothetical protein